MAEMPESSLRGILASHITNAVGFDGQDAFANDRREAEKYYKGEPFGDEREGQSKVVSRDVAEAVDSLLPPTLKIFTSGDEVVRFDPTGPEDEQVSQQATDYCNHIWNVQNPGFANFHSWFKDAYLKRLGTMKIWWDTEEQVKKERYQGLTADQFQMLTADPDVEVVEDIEYPDPTAMMALPPPVSPESGPAAPAPLPTLHDCVVQRRKNIGRVHVEPVPPEEYLFEKRLKGDDDKGFRAHRRKRTVSDLIADGYDKEQVQSLGGNTGEDLNSEKTERFSPETNSGDLNETAPVDPALREVWVTECYLPIDYDQDGIAEYRKITVAGDGTQLEILKREGKADNEEVDDHPFATLTPIPMPHKLVGMSIADKARDLQLLKSTLWRQALDSLYLNNQPMIGAVQDQVNLDDLLNRRRGGVVRIKSPTALVPVPTTDVSPSAFNMIAYVDSVREARTGVRRFSAGPGADALHNAYTETATGVQELSDSSDEMILYFARVFAETGVKRAFRRILQLVCQYQDRPKMIRLRNEWVPMDPREWNSQMDMSVQVGLGTGNKAQQIATVSNLLQVDQSIIQLQGGIDGPIVTGKNVYNKLKKLIEASGLKSVETYYTDPESPEMKAVVEQKKQQPNPEVQKEQMKFQLETQKAQHDAGLKQQEMQANLAMKQAELELKRQEAEQAMALKRAEFEMQMQHDAAKFQQQMAHDQAMAHVNLQHNQMAGEQKLAFAEQAAQQKAKQQPKGEGAKA